MPEQRPSRAPLAIASAPTRPRRAFFWPQRKIVAEKGVLALYRGLTSLLVGTVPKTSLRFGVFGKIKEAFKDEKGVLTPGRTLIAGMATGLVEATLVVTPVETMKTVLIADQNSAKPKYNGLLHGVRSIIAEKGLLGVYKGWAPTAAKQMGNQGIRFTTYEAIKNVSHLPPAAALVMRRFRYVPSRPNRAFSPSGGPRGNAQRPAAPTARAYPRPTPTPRILPRHGCPPQSMRPSGEGGSLHPTQLMLAGGAAGFISVVLTMPFDVVKTRMQGLDAAMYEGTVDCVQKVYTSEGITAFWKGMAARLPRVVFGQSITLAGYDVFMRLLSKIA